MKRKEFIQNSILGFAGLSTISTFLKNTQELVPHDTKMPVLFVGHGNPMNAIEKNEFSLKWSEIGKEIPKPRAILCISAHWETKGTKVTAMEQPKTIHDFGGFPKELFETQYPAPGSAKLAQEAIESAPNKTILKDFDWGLDHGCWSVLKPMFPNADIPVIQLSIDYTKPMEYHVELAKELASLRKKGFLIIGSGNIVHNLYKVNFQQSEGFDWAESFNQKVKELAIKGDKKSLVQYEKLGRDALLSVPTPEHYIPLLYAMGTKNEEDNLSFFNDKTMMGSISMTSVKIG